MVQSISKGFRCPLWGPVVSDICVWLCVCIMGLFGWIAECQSSGRILTEDGAEIHKLYRG